MFFVNSVVKQRAYENDIGNTVYPTKYVYSFSALFCGCDIILLGIESNRLNNFPYSSRLINYHQCNLDNCIGTGDVTLKDKGKIGRYQTTAINDKAPTVSIIINLYST